MWSNHYDKFGYYNNIKTRNVYLLESAIDSDMTIIPFLYSLTIKYKLF